MWKRINHEITSDSSVPFKDMRFFVYYPPKDTMRLIDVSETALVDDILTLVKREFDLNIEDSSSGEISIVLSYNGADLKPKWSLAELNIPSGSIIRCLYREKKAADLYIHCSYNKQIFKLFNSGINVDTSIGTVRKIISDRLGLPLSVFCLETFDGKQRLYDPQTLIDYDLKPHEHVYLKVWQGYEKFINACVKGFTERYARDDLARHYQTQIALHIAAFHGHLELASSVMQHGARSDRPVGEHPSRQWASQSAGEVSSEKHRCPIHIAVERGHVKMVDLFVRQSILCTQIPDPVTGRLPYRTALACSVAAVDKQEKQRYRVIYFFLHDKQYNLRIPLNSTGEYVSDLLTSSISANAIHHASGKLAYVSLPFYYKIISWYERAHERAWKKYSGQFPTVNQSKRVYPKQGLLGYKVLIDGFNNTFDAPETHHQRSSAHFRARKAGHYLGVSEEEQQKLLQTKLMMQDIALSERRRTKQIAAANLRHTRRPPLLLSSKQSINHNKQPSIVSDSIYSSSITSSGQKQASSMMADLKTFESISENDIASTIDLVSSVMFSAPPRAKRIEDNRQSAGNAMRWTKSEQKKLPLIPSITISEEEKSMVSPAITVPLKVSASCPALPKNLEPIIPATLHDNASSMPSADAYSIYSLRTSQEMEQRQETARRKLFSQVTQSVADIPDRSPKKAPTLLTVPVPAERHSIDVDSYIALADHPTVQRLSPIKSHIDVAVRQAAVQPYERYASASTRATAVRCLQEASYFKRKSWLKQVQISQEMVKSQVKRRIRRADRGSPLCLPLRTTHGTTPTH